MVIELEKVRKVYNQGETNEVIALNDVSLQIGEAEMVCIQGPSGSGKSTLLSIIGCILLPTRGVALIGGKKLTRMPEHLLIQYRREMIGFVFQNYNLLEHLTVLDNVTLPLLPLGWSPAKRKILGQTLLEKFDLTHRENFYPNQLSGGQMQRVALARALINNPSIIVADEPTAHLDEKLSMEVISLFGTLKDEGKSIIISSHDRMVAEHPMVDRVLEMRGAEIL